MPKIISERCELVKLGHINRSGQVFSRHSVEALCTVCARSHVIQDVVGRWSVYVAMTLLFRRSRDTDTYRPLITDFRRRRDLAASQSMRASARFSIIKRSALMMITTRDDDEHEPCMPASLRTT